MNYNGMTFLGNGSVLNLQEDVVRFGPLRFWAERGLVHVEDATDNSYEVMSVRTFLSRARGLSDMIGNSTQREMHSEDRYDQMERTRHLTFLEGAANLARKAQIQGMPSDPSARRELVRRRPKSVVVPAYGGGM